MDTYRIVVQKTEAPLSWWAKWRMQRNAKRQIVAFLKATRQATKVWAVEVDLAAGRWWAKTEEPMAVFGIPTPQWAIREVSGSIQEE